MKSAATKPTLNERDCYAKLRLIGQEHLLAYWATLRPAQKEILQSQITSLDIDLFHRMQSAKGHLKHSLEPFSFYSQIGDRERRARGMRLVTEGKIALVVLAGGQGSRLRYSGPKGCYPVTLIKRKSLFQLLAEKVKAAGIQVGRALQVAIMTSPLNHVETETFFAQHAFFGLTPYQVNFFDQTMWPFLDLNGDLFLESPGQIAQGPNGNGSIFQRLVASGIWEKWSQSGIEIVNVVPIDNPLADPFDFELFGTHAQDNCDVTVKATLRRDARENVGVLAQMEGKTTVIEYSEMSAEDKSAADAQGNLKFGIANLSLFSFSMPFIQKIGAQKLPLHRAKKAVSAMTPEGSILFPEAPNAWKCEEFIFDALPFAEKIQALLYPRSITFAPLKNLKGEDSIDTVQEALLAFDRQRYAEVTGVQPPQEARFELAPPFYYPTAEMLKQWKGRPFPKEEYIHE